jgi:signal transduction histidine kinase
MTPSDGFEPERSPATDQLIAAGLLASQRARLLRATLGAAVLVIGLAAFAGAPVQRPLLYGGLLALATVPLAASLFGLPIGESLVAITVAAAIAVINVGGQSLALFDKGNSQFSLVITCVAAGYFASSMPPRVSIPLCSVAVAIPLARGITDPDFDATFIWATATVTSALAGYVFSAIMRTTVELQRSNVRLRAAQEALVHKAALRERQRIAREIHDVIAHSLTVSMLHLTAARLAVQRGDSEAAAEYLEEAEHSGRDSLADVRRTIGLLRDGDSWSLAPPRPSTADVTTLIQAFHDAGLDVHLEGGADLGAVSPAIGLTLFRLVQEGLTNAGKHARDSTVVVRIDQESDVLSVAVTNDGGPYAPPRGGGHGLVGMYERVEASGGWVRSGPVGEDWKLEARLALEREGATS